MKRKIAVLAILIFMLVLSACQTPEETKIAYHPQDLQFSGDRALALESEFVGQFPNRASGQPNNRLAAEWLLGRFEELGLECQLDEWEVENYSKMLPLSNVICLLPGQSEQEILLMAHHDQSPFTVEGADHGGSGVGVLLQLAEVFAAEGYPFHTIVFLSADGAAFGGLGSRRYVQSNDDIDKIAASITLDNLGLKSYGGLGMVVTGQFRNYGPLWLQKMAQEVAGADGDLWIPKIQTVLLQLAGQTLPISFRDQGPPVAASVPALGLYGAITPENDDEIWATLYSDADNLDLQSPDVLQQGGRTAEAMVRKLQSITTFPDESGPYLYFEESNKTFRGAPLWLLFFAFIALFVVASWLTGRNLLIGYWPSLKRATPHFIAWWVPLILSVFLLYIFVAVDLMNDFELYPATFKDPALTRPQWGVLVLYLAGLGELLHLGRTLEVHLISKEGRPSFQQIKSLALLIIALAAIYFLFVNPMSLVAMVPLVSWFFITGRSGRGRIVDLFLFLLGGLFIYLLLYYLGGYVLHTGPLVIWYVITAISIRMVNFPTVAVISAVVAAGLSLVLNVPHPKQEKGSRGKDVRD